MRELPKQIELARKRAFHALGERLYMVEYRPLHGPKHWWVHVRYGGEIVPFSASVVGVAIAEAASRLHATGWTPTHERLEWEPNGNRLFLLAGRARLPVATYLLPTLDVLIHEVPGQPWHRAGTVAEMVEHIAGWVENNLPYYLPPFPGAV